MFDAIASPVRFTYPDGTESSVVDLYDALEIIEHATAVCPAKLAAARQFVAVADEDTA